ncbi:IclR family transcriptional regulator [Chelatococcus reniformis]|uniref:Transcriptional regulator n=1 Tax=Chelatococcus reniformis TaxID=1494448 RepID=A0A916XDS9_9HYPH|nr:IclR family transcriptional regulator [Chelatococcus reniformis]GGC63194.1 transcriptional regulator [Chelatococcus reniformis]
MPKTKLNQAPERDRPAPVTGNEGAIDGAPVPASPRAARESDGRTATRRPREGAADAEGGRLFVAALARGLEVLGAFRARDGALGNQELAERTGLPKPTISRITHTLMQLGYLTYNPRLANYELGARTLSLAFAALSNLDIRRIARPLMQTLADSGNMNISLSLRDRLQILAVETCEGSALIGLRLPAGTRMPIGNTSMGKAWLASAPEPERATVLDALRRQAPDDWPRLKRAVELAVTEVAEHGYCTSIGEWQRDINGAAAPIVMPDGRGVYVLALGGPAYLLSEEQIAGRYGRMLADTASQIAAQIGGSAQAEAVP